MAAFLVVKQMSSRNGRRLFLPEVWIHLVELPHLAIGSPTQVAVTGVLQDRRLLSDEEFQFEDDVDHEPPVRP
jgi:hypothetical protein